MGRFYSGVVYLRHQHLSQQGAAHFCNTEGWHVRIQLRETAFTVGHKVITAMENIFSVCKFCTAPPFPENQHT